MAKPFAKGIVDDISQSPKHKPSYKKTLWEITVEGQQIQFYGDLDFEEGDTVVVWANEKNGQTNYNIKKDGGSSVGGGYQKKAYTQKNTTSAPQQTNESFDTRQASIVAQNALNRGTDIVETYCQNVRAAVTAGITGVNKSTLSALCDMEVLEEMAKETANKYHKLLMEGDLEKPLPKFDKEEDA